VRFIAEVFEQSDGHQHAGDDHRAADDAVEDPRSLPAHQGDHYPGFAMIHIELPIAASGHHREQAEGDDDVPDERVHGETPACTTISDRGQLMKF
jgi:hypothetical protein